MRVYDGKQIFKFAVRVILLGLVLVYLSIQLDVKETFGSMRQISLLALAAGMLLMFSRYMLLGLRWYLSVQKPKPSLRWFLIREQHTLFLEMAIPIPGIEDAVRIMLLSSSKIPWQKALMGAVRMRIAGLTVMVLLLLVFFAGSGDIVFGTGKSFQYALISLTLLVLTPASLPLLRFGIRFAKKIPGLEKSPLFKQIAHLTEEQQSFFQIPILIVVAFAQNCVQALVIFVLLTDLGEPISFIELVTLIPLLNLSLILPLSVQGYGLPEAAMVFLLPFAGIDAQIASTIAMAHLLLYTLQIAVSALVFFATSELSVTGIYRSISTQVDQLKRKKRPLQ